MSVIFIDLDLFSQCLCNLIAACLVI